MTNNVYLDIVTDKQFDRTKKKLPKIAALFVQENDPYSQDYEFIFSKLPTIFSSELQFCVLTDRTAKRNFKKLHITKPTIVFFTNGQLSFSIPFPTSESELIGIISYFMTPDSQVITDKKKLYDLLGQTAYTLLATPKLLDIANQMRVALSEVYGIFSVFCVSPELIKELGFEPYKLLIYRHSDKVLTEIGSSKHSIEQAIIPTIFSHLQKEQIERATKTLALLVTNRKLTNDEKQGLIDLSQQYKQFLFGSADVQECDFVIDLIGDNTKELPFFLVFNSQDYFYYPNNNKVFTLESASQYLKDIKEERIQKEYPSEEIPKTQENKFLTKVVGKNYEQFVSQEDKDVLMFYVNDETPQEMQLPYAVSSYLNQTDIVCGYINIRPNSSPIGFPTLFGNPHIQLFPAYKKDLNCTYYGSTSIFSIVNFLRRNSRAKIDLDMSLLDRNFEMSYLVNLVNDMGDYPEEMQIEVARYVEEIGRALGIGSNIQQITEALYKTQGGFTNE